MIYIKEYENVVDGQDVDFRIFNAYCEAKVRGYDFIDFRNTIWNKEWKEIVAFLDRNDIKEFTISNTGSILMSNLYELKKLGWNVNGLITIISNIGEEPALLIKKVSK